MFAADSFSLDESVFPFKVLLKRWPESFQRMLCRYLSVDEPEQPFFYLNDNSPSGIVYEFHTTYDISAAFVIS